MRIRFGDFVLDGGRRELTRGPDTLHLSPKALRLLELLVTDAPDAVSRDDLYKGLWPDTFVDDANLPNLVAEVRKALDDDSRNPRFVRTVHGFGYAFLEVPVRDAAWAAFVLQWGGREFPLREGVTVIGRDAAVDVQIESPGVSRRHAAFSASRGAVSVEDLESKNGTYVDGVKITKAVPVTPASEVRLGSATVRIRSLEQPHSTMTVAPGTGDNETPPA